MSDKKKIRDQSDNEDKVPSEVDTHTSCGWCFHQPIVKNKNRFCQQCGHHFCDGCIQNHNSIPAYKDHIPNGASAAAASSHGFCQEHKATQKFFCENCQEACCAECFLEGHKGHQEVRLEEQIKRKKSWAREEQAAIKEFIVQEIDPYREMSEVLKKVVRHELQMRVVLDTATRDGIIAADHSINQIDEIERLRALLDADEEKCEPPSSPKSPYDHYRKMSEVLKKFVQHELHVQVVLDTTTRDAILEADRGVNQSDEIERLRALPDADKEKREPPSALKLPYDQELELTKDNGAERRGSELEMTRDNTAEGRDLKTTMDAALHIPRPQPRDSCSKNGRWTGRFRVSDIEIDELYSSRREIRVNHIPWSFSIFRFNNGCLVVGLEADRHNSLPRGWQVSAKCTIVIVHPTDMSKNLTQNVSQTFTRDSWWWWIIRKSRQQWHCIWRFKEEVVAGGLTDNGYLSLEFKVETTGAKRLPPCSHCRH